MALICLVGSVAIVPVDVLQVHDLVIVQQLLGNCLELVRSSLLLETTVRELAVLPALAAIILWVHCFDLYDDRAESLLDLGQILLTVMLQHLIDVHHK